MQKFLKIIATLLSGSIIIGHADAQEFRMIEAVPTKWCVQDHKDGAIAIWFSGSSCVNGKLMLYSSVNSDVKQRFWSMIMTAKAAKMTIGVYYDPSSDQCEISNFFLKKGG